MLQGNIPVAILVALCTVHRASKKSVFNARERFTADEVSQEQSVMTYYWLWISSPINRQVSGRAVNIILVAHRVERILVCKPKDKLTNRAETRPQDVAGKKSVVDFHITV